MINYLYEWMREIAYYMVLMTAIMQVAAAESYRKYIRLFTGIILVLMIMAPVMQIFGITEKETWMQEAEYEKGVQEIEEKVRELENESVSGAVDGDGAEDMANAAFGSGESAEIGAEKDAGRIKVEEIHIGR